MPLAQPFQQPRQLGDILASLDQLPRHGWLYISASVSRIALDTLCYPTAFNSHDVSPDEQDEFELLAEREGMRCWFCHEQLEDIRANLGTQQPVFSLEQLVCAIDFYWKHDAFIDLSTKAA